MQIERAGFWPWFLQRLTGLYLAVGMAVHMFVLPLKGGAVNFYSVHGRLQHAGWLIFDLLLLAACLYHGFNGVWAIVLDYNPRRLWRKGMGYLIFIVGVVFLVYGIAALIPLTGG